GAEQLSTKLGLLNDSRVRFRTEPNLTSETLGFLNKGDRVLVLEQSADKMQIGDMNDYWYRIRTPEGTEGWTYGYFIDVRE
ncbi:MAG: SH3 domain-containing protein, partial [Tannerellaceae bacterium]|nr:SH3 domain-containing protein [Tannerellaceae bacterium]